MNNKLTTGVVVAVIALIGVGLMAYMQQSKDQASNAAHEKTQHSYSNDGKEFGSSTEEEQIQEANMVIYQDFAVAQPKIEVKKGTTVTWVNKDTAKHDVTPVEETDEFKASKLFGKDESYQVTFNTVGTYEYFCSPHPYMKGTIEVVE